MKIINVKQESPAIDTLHVVDGQHRIIAVTWRAGRRRGQKETVNLSPLIDTHKFYAPVRKHADLFNTVHVIDDGYAIAWGDESIDMSAASVERLAEEAISGKEFGAFLQRNRLTHQAAAAALGRSKRQIENYLQCDSLPRVMALACIGYEARTHSECSFPSQEQAAKAGKTWLHHLDQWPSLEANKVCVSYESSVRLSNNSGCFWTLPVDPAASRADYHMDVRCIQLVVTEGRREKQQEAASALRRKYQQELRESHEGFIATTKATVEGFAKDLALTSNRSTGAGRKEAGWIALGLHRSRRHSASSQTQWRN